MEDRFTRLEAALKAELTKSLEKGLKATNDGIKQIHSWIRMIIGTISIGVMLKLVFYERYMEEKLIARIQESETKSVSMEERLITKIQESEAREEECPILFSELASGVPSMIGVTTYFRAQWICTANTPVVKFWEISLFG
ncbi:hypothetical protein B9Z19DRAFT_1062406 [Tuber borchii]|uniref:Uncharacterized protein n=1 Tax=Tuber borchii TaxID=42251 RepID=A0A2T7A1U0_TUBBO|nr:hypothetical protein B9Z19DRAFT_1062406 [Tuber borchii]